MTDNLEIEAQVLPESETKVLSIEEAEKRIKQLTNELNNILNLSSVLGETTDKDLLHLLNKKIADFSYSLSFRTLNALKNCDVIYLHELVQHSETQLLRIPNFGNKCLKEVKELLDSLNLHLDMDISHFKIMQDDYFKDSPTPPLLVENLITHLFRRNRKIYELFAEIFKLREALEKEQSFKTLYKEQEKTIEDLNKKIGSLQRDYADLRTLRENMVSIRDEKINSQIKDIKSLEKAVASLKEENSLLKENYTEALAKSLPNDSKKSGFLSKLKKLASQSEVQDD